MEKESRAIHIQARRASEGWRGCVVFLRLRFGLVWGSVFLLATAAGAADLAETTQLFRGGKYAECVKASEKAIAENDFSENYRLLKIRAEMELGRYPDALKTFDEALRRFSPSVQLRCLG